MLSCGEIVLVVSHGADIAHFYVLRLHSHLHQLLAVALLEVYMPLGLPFGYGVHIKSSLGKLLIHLLTHLEVVERYTRSNHAVQVFSLGMICQSHRLYCLLGNSRHSSPPSGMHCRHGMVLGVIYNNRYAVGSRYSYTYSAHVGHHGIHSFEYHLADILRKMHEILGDLPHYRSVSLMRHNEMGLINAKFLT